jgi:hypothetical protein
LIAHPSTDSPRGGPKSIEALQRSLKEDTHAWSRAAAEVALRKLEKK